MQRRIDFQNPDLHNLTYFYDFFRIVHKSVSKLRNMNQSILMHSDVHEGSEVGDVGHHPFEFHPGGEILDFLYLFLEGRVSEFLPGIAPGLLQLSNNIPQGWFTDRLGRIAPEIKAP